MTGTVTNDGQSIAYTVVGEGAPLVLLHGFSDSAQSWAEMGYVEPLLAAGRRLVIIDLRGHGESSKPHDADSYAPGRRASDIAAVLDALEIAKADVYGYSMGGWVALNFARFYPERLDRLVVGGAHPFGQNMEGYRAAVAKRIDDWIGVLDRLNGGPLPEALKARIRKNDLAALQAAVAEDRPDISHELAGQKRVSLFFVGSEDPLRADVLKCADLIPGAKAVEIPGGNHLTTLLRAEAVIPHLIALLEPA